jgi:hypothetical protein
VVEARTIQHTFELSLDIQRAAAEFIALMAYPEARLWREGGAGQHFCRALTDFQNTLLIERDGLGAIRKSQADKSIRKPNKQRMFKTLWAGYKRWKRRMEVADLFHLSLNFTRYEHNGRTLFVTNSLKKIIESNIVEGKLTFGKNGHSTRLRDRQTRLQEIDEHNAVLRTYKAELRESKPVLHIAIAMRTIGNLDFWIKKNGPLPEGDGVTWSDELLLYLINCRDWLHLALERSEALRQSAGVAVPKAYVAEGMPTRSTQWFDEAVPYTETQRTLAASRPSKWYPTNEAMLADFPAELHPKYRRVKHEVVSDEAMKDWFNIQTYSKPYCGVLGKYAPSDFVYLYQKLTPLRPMSE